MLGSIGRSALLVVPTVAMVAALAACNGARNPNGTPAAAPTTPTTFQTTSTAPPSSSSGGKMGFFGGLQASDATLTATLEDMNGARAKNNLPALARDAQLDSCANVIAVQLSQGGSPSGTCGASQVSEASSQGGTQDAVAQSAVQQWVNEGPPPAGQTNDYSNVMNPKYQTVGIGIVTGSSGTFVVVLFR